MAVHGALKLRRSSMGCIEVAATRTAISMARWPGRQCSGDDDDAPAAVLLAGGDDDIDGIRVSGARDAAGERGRRSGRPCSDEDAYVSRARGMRRGSGGGEAGGRVATRMPVGEGSITLFPSSV